MSSCSMRLVGCLSLTALFAGCGGGGGAAALPTTNSVVPAAYSTIILQIKSTATSSSARRPLYVSPGTKSVQVTVTLSGGTPATTTANCAATCSATLQAPVGADQFAVVLYDAQNGTGNVLSRATAAQTIVAGQTNTLNITFGGVIASLSVAADATQLRSGVAGSIPVDIVARDADGYAIVGPTAYTVPIALTLSDPTGATSLSTAVVTSPAAAPTLAYRGASSGANATITASTSGVPSASTHITVAPVGGPTPPPGGAPLHIPDMAYYQGINVNTRISPAWFAQHYTMTQQNAYGGNYAASFLAAGGKYAMEYTDPDLVPYCSWPAPYGCAGPIGNTVTAESGWLHDASGARLHVISNGTQSSGHWQLKMNPADPSVQASFATYTAAFPGNSVFADDIGGSIDPTPPGYNDYDLYKYGALPREYCTGTAAACEQPSSRYLSDVGALLNRSAYPVFTNGGAAPENISLMQNNPNVIGNMLEGCYAPGMSDASWQSKQNYMLQVTAMRRYSLCLSYFQSNLAAERAFNLASYWMVYDGTYAVLWETMTLSSGDQGIMPEYGVVPGSATVDPTRMSDVQRGPGLYVREFTGCAQNGTTFGRCAAIVNTSNATLTLPPLSVSYSQKMDFSGTTSWYDGGAAQWSGGVPATIGPQSGIVLR